MKRRIYIKQWLELKPYDKQTSTDSYYLKLSNNIKTTLMKGYSYDLEIYLGEEGSDLMSCFLASYFEDIISETNVWNSFINYHSKLYNKKLPFYNTDEYYENEINEQDISFLVWYFLNTFQEEKFVTPFNDFIIDIASEVMQVLEKEYEFAPENKHLKSFYNIDKDEDDYYIMRHFIDRILFNTYLFFPDTSLKLEEQEYELIEQTEEKTDEDTLMYLREHRDSFLHKNCTRLLSLKGNEWAAEILGEEHPASTGLLNMSQRIRGFFLYKGQDEQNIFLEHIASGKKFELTKKSYDRYSELEEIDTIMFLGIVQWKNEWWFSGISFQTEFDPNLVLDEKNSLSSRMEVNFLDHNQQDTANVLQEQQDAFLTFNNGSPIAFMRSGKINDFYESYIEYFNNSLNLSKKEMEQAENRAKKEGYFGEKNKEKPDFTEISETGLFFFNPKTGVEIALGVNSAFPLKNNPFYNIKESEGDILHLLMSEEMSTELVKYCIDNCKTKLPFFKDDIGKEYLEDIDFLLRFWKKENYHSKPSLTYTGLGKE
ncbi:MAG: DUF3843 family protein [Ignavibacteria bacterium]|jgi:hypothetical protein